MSEVQDSKYKITFVIPWATDKNIGKSYNSAMQMISKNDFVCFIDGDAMFTTPFFGKQLEDIVAKYPECGCFTAVTNRIGCEWQRTGNLDTNDISSHRNYGMDLYQKRYYRIMDVSNVPKMEVMGGVLILLKRALWEKIGGFKETGMLGIDNDLHWKIQKHGEKLYLMEGVYLYHWYRGGRGNKNHLL